MSTILSTIQYSTDEYDIMRVAATLPVDVLRSELSSGSEAVARRHTHLKPAAALPRFALRRNNPRTENRCPLASLV